VRSAVEVRGRPTATAYAGRDGDRPGQRQAQGQANPSSALANASTSSVSPGPAITPSRNCRNCSQSAAPRSTAKSRGPAATRDRPVNHRRGKRRSFREFGSDTSRLGARVTLGSVGGGWDLKPSNPLQTPDRPLIGPAESGTGRRRLGVGRSRLTNRLASDRRGSTDSVGWPALARSQFAITSARCSSSHSRTRRRARPGSEPANTPPVSITISASSPE
jgi:hypothetical protein